MPSGYCTFRKHINNVQKTYTVYLFHCLKRKRPVFFFKRELLIFCLCLLRNSDSLLERVSRARALLNIIQHNFKISNSE